MAPALPAGAAREETAMSNTADVSPYEDTDTALDGAREIGTAAAPLGAALAATLAAALARDAAGEAAREAARAQRRQDRIAGARLHLHGSDPAPLLEAARALGFAPLPALAAGPVELANAAGERIALVASGGRLALAGTLPAARLRALVGAASLAQARRHLEAFSGGRVAVRRLANGETELHAVEAVPAGRGGKAAITARVAPDGVARLDIDGLRGPRCEAVLADFARAVGGQPRNKRLKPAYHASPGRPGEPARLHGKG